MNILSASLVLAFVFSSTIYGKDAKMEPISNFDLNQYLGKWYEIARLPASFEKNLINVTATYSMRNDGKVKVENQGIDQKSNKNKIAIGKAKFAGNSNIGYLKVSFFGPFYADYKIIELDTNYQFALVMSSTKYAWILSRSPKLDSVIVNKLLEKAKMAGINTLDFYFTPQN